MLRLLKMIERVKVRCNEIDGRGQRKATNVLLEKANTRAPAIAARLAEHRSRFINGVNRHSPAAIQVTSEQSCTASDVRHRAKANPVPPHQPFEGIPDTQKKRQTHSAIVNRRDPAVWRRHEARAGEPDQVNVTWNSGTHFTMTMCCFVNHPYRFDEGPRRLGRGDFRHRSP
jgi:hypothetical protein